MKRTISVVLALLFIAAFASAQAKAQLTIICNVSGAQVFLAGQLIGNTNPNLALNIRVGTYPLKIIKKGYVDFDATVTIAGAGAVLQANLVPKGGAAAPNTLPAPNTIAVPQVYNYDLSISSNVTNAEVVINGNHAGQTPFVAQLPNGSYTITVRAPGYLDFNQNVVVNGGPLQVNAMLQGQNYQVSVSANVNGALVFMNTRAPFTFALTLTW